MGTEPDARRTLWRWLSLAAAVIALNVSLAFRNWWPTPAIRWNGDLSIELAAGLLAAGLIGRRAGSWPSRAVRWLSAAWVLVVIARYADVTTSALYGREVNLYWDVRHLSAVTAMLVRPAAWWLVPAVLGAAVLVPLALYRVLHAAICRVNRAIARAPERRLLEVVTLVVLVLFALQRADRRLGILGFSAPVTSSFAHQARLLAHEMTAARGRSVAPQPPIRSDLARVRGADVLLIFIESYGAVSFDRPEFAGRLAGSRARFAADIQASGRRVLSAFVESPTFGGSSWLAHVSLLSGVEVRDEDTNVILMAQKRDTVVSAFAHQGYRTVAIMPGVHRAWPEGAFYGFNDIYDEARLDYRGPPFGWWSVPDQFALARLDALEIDKQPRPPVLAFYPTTNTHAPFSPTPPFQPDWPRVLTDHPFDQDELERSWEQTPDWLDLGPGYVRSLAYTYEVLGDYLRLHAGRDIVMILIGDHQPPAAVTGEGQSWNVAMHVIASRPAILDALAARGFQPQLAPKGPALGKMHALMPLLLQAFSSGK